MRSIPLALVMLTLVAFMASSPAYGGDAYKDPIYGYTVTSDVVYRPNAPVSSGTKNLLCDIYQPVDIGQGPVPANRPGVVIQDGGAWTSGSKTHGRVVIPTQYMVRRGFTVVITDYRQIEDGTLLNPSIQGQTEFGTRPWVNISAGLPSSIYPGIDSIRSAIEDFAVGIAWTRSHAAELGIDANRMAACGGSAGGVDVLCLQYNNNPVPEGYRVQAVMGIVGTMFGNWNKINAGAPPCFMLNNTLDPLIWYDPDIPNFNNRLTQLGVYHEQWYQVTQVNHDFDYNEIVQGVPIMERMNQFFCYHLAGGPLQVGYTLGLVASPSSAGTIIASPAPRSDGTYAAGTVVTLTANPAAGYAFSGWSGDASGSDTYAQVTMTAHRNVTASFVELRYSLSLGSNPPAGGTIVANPAPGGDGKYGYGTVVTLTANAGTDYGFSNWSGDASGSSNPVQITMNSDKSVTANFIVLRYALTLTGSPAGSGSVAANPLPDGDGKYALGAVVTLTATPAAGFVLANWSGDASGSSNPTTVTMNGNKNVTANFADGQVLTLNVVKGEYGTVTVEPNLPLYAPGTVVTLTATPIEGKSFNEWTIWEDPNLYPDAQFATIDGNPVLQLTMNHDYTVEAAFKCGSGTGQMLPLLVIGVAVLGIVSRRTWRRD